MASPICGAANRRAAAWNRLALERHEAELRVMLRETRLDGADNR
jgi:hypothetical protein